MKWYQQTSRLAKIKNNILSVSTKLGCSPNSKMYNPIIVDFAIYARTCS